jgi:glycosyltransferase involved in cell wall biosynthesis
MNILSYQSFSLYMNGGGSRILRRLYRGYEAAVVSLAIEAGFYRTVAGLIPEKVVPAIPLRRPWMKWRSRDIATWIREKPLKQYTLNRILQEARSIDFDVLHIMSCGPWSTALCGDKALSGKAVWMSVHDHFATTQCPSKDARRLWNLADRRLVISPELGNEYQHLFGRLPYELITDGVLPNEMSTPAEAGESPIVIYFAGLLHIEYIPLVKTLADALDILTRRGLCFKLVFRGTQKLSFLKGRSFEMSYLPVVLDDTVLKQDLDAAAILYLPIKFVDPDFYRYSLSTKMVGYLGAAGSVLYHGPRDSAAGRLLHETKSAVSCNSLDAEEMARCIIQLIEERTNISANAKELARRRFNLELIQKRFWLGTTCQPEHEKNYETAFTFGIGIS